MYDTEWSKWQKTKVDHYTEHHIECIIKQAVNIQAENTNVFLIQSPQLKLPLNTIHEVPMAKNNNNHRIM